MPKISLKTLYCYIFEKPKVQGHQNWYSQLSNTQIHKYTYTQIHKYKYAHTNTNTNTGGAQKSNFDFLPKNKSFHENGHISGTVRPTSLRHHSNRSSWRARPEKHLRGPLTCPGNTGEPEAPVSGGHWLIEFGSWVKKMTKTREWIFLFFLAHLDNWCQLPYQKAAQGCIRNQSRRFGYRETRRTRSKPLSIHAKPDLISGMDFHQKWTKTKGSHDQIQIQIHKYKYKYTNTNTNSHIQIQIQIQEGLRSQILTFFRKIKVFTKTDISLEPLDLHRFNTTQIEALGVPDEKNTSGGL